MKIWICCGGVVLAVLLLALHGHAPPVSSALIVAGIAAGVAVALTMGAAVGWLVWRAAREARERRTGPVRPLPVYRTPPARGRVLEETSKPVIEPSRVTGPHRVPLNPGQLAEILRRSQRPEQ